MGDVVLVRVMGHTETVNRSKMLLYIRTAETSPSLLISSWSQTLVQIQPFYTHNDYRNP